MQIQLYGRTIELANPSWETEARWGGRLSPEPETVAWIESMAPGEVFFDVGANVGYHAIRAACRGLCVHAFEPQVEQQAELARNAKANGLNITTHWAAVSNFGGMGSIVPGRSAATLEPAGNGNVPVVTLDQMAKTLQLQPHHIKIDVDGNEPEIIEGGRGTIAKAKSVLIEIDPGAPGHTAIVSVMRELGFSFDPAQVEACREPEGTKFAGMANHIFRRA